MIALLFNARISRILTGTRWFCQHQEIIEDSLEIGFNLYYVCDVYMYVMFVEYSDDDDDDDVHFERVGLALWNKL